jgi:hypothetical protein
MIIANNLYKYGDIMSDYIERLVYFCKKEPLWALAFFFCGYVIGETYFIL